MCVCVCVCVCVCNAVVGEFTTNVSGFSWMCACRVVCGRRLAGLRIDSQGLVANVLQMLGGREFLTGLALDRIVCVGGFVRSFVRSLWPLVLVACRSFPAHVHRATVWPHRTTPRHATTTDAFWCQSSSKYRPLGRTMILIAWYSLVCASCRAATRNPAIVRAVEAMFGLPCTVADENAFAGAVGVARLVSASR